MYQTLNVPGSARWLRADGPKFTYPIRRFEESDKPENAPAPVRYLVRDGKPVNQTDGK